MGSASNGKRAFGVSKIRNTPLKTRGLISNRKRGPSIKKWETNLTKKKYIASDEKGSLLSYHHHQITQTDVVVVFSLHEGEPFNKTRCQHGA
jgi:hypothetical protein